MRYNNEPQFFIADADILLAIAADMMERLGEHLDPEMLDPELVQRLREAWSVSNGGRRPASERGAPHLPGRHRPEPGEDHRLAGAGGVDRGATVIGSDSSSRSASATW